MGITRNTDCSYSKPWLIQGAQAAPAPSQPAPQRYETGKGNTLSFPAGASVVGFRITIGGRQYNSCFFEAAPGAGTVTDGVYGDVYPGEKQKPC